MRNFYTGKTPVLCVRMISSFNAHPTMLTSFGKQLTPENATPGEASVTTLSNGTRIITHDLDGPSTAIGIYVKAGSAYDPSKFPGMNYALRWCFLTSNVETSQFQIDKSFRSVGASYEHTELRKKLLAFKLESNRESWKGPLSNMLSCMTVPRFPQSEILKVQDAMENATEELRWKYPREWCIEQVEQLAFKGEVLGNPRNIVPYFVDELTSAALQEQWSRTFLPNRVTIAGVNVNHTDLVMQCESQTFAHHSSALHFTEINDDSEAMEEQMYQGGNELDYPEKREKEMSTKPFLENETIGAITWRTYGASSPKKFATALILQQILEILLHERTKVENTMIDHGMRSFYRPFANIGLFGMTFRDKSTDAIISLKDALSLYRKLKQEITTRSIDRAKNRAKLRFFHDNIELRRDYIDFLALCTKVDVTVSPYHAILSEIDEVKEADIKKLISYTNSSAPCMYTMGDVFSIPSLRQLGIDRASGTRQIVA